MAKEFTRKIRNTVLTGDRKEPFYTNKELDLLGDKEDAYIRLKQEYHCLTDNIKQLYSPDDSIIIDKYDKNNANISIEVGGVNLLDDSKKEIEIVPRDTGTSEDNFQLYRIPCLFKNGGKYSFSFKLNDTIGDIRDITVRMTDKEQGTLYPSTVKGGKNVKVGERVNYKFYSFSPLNPSEYFEGEIIIYAGILGETRGQGITFSEIKLEKGTVATDWTPSLNDMKKYVDTEVDKLRDEFNNFVYQYRDEKKELEGQISNLNSRVSALERG